jgi:hypothetical protein
MAAVDKDFKVKNGLQVTGDAVIGGTITAASPTESDHVATKSYVDALAAGIPVSDIPPENPDNGDLWFDTLVERINVYYEGQWMTVATIDDTLTIPDHIHDTSIDGNGLIVTQFVSGGSFNDPQGTPIDGGAPDTIDFSDTYDGGIAVDNFN